MGPAGPKIVTFGVVSFGLGLPTTRGGTRGRRYRRLEGGPRPQSVLVSGTFISVLGTSLPSTPCLPSALGPKRTNNLHNFGGGEEAFFGDDNFQTPLDGSFPSTPGPEESRRCRDYGH